MERMLDKKQIRAIFLFEFKMGCKAVETICNTNNTFGPGTVNKCTVQWWFKVFCKEDESREDAPSDQPLEVDGDDWEPSSKLILRLHEKLLKNSTLTTALAFEANWKGEKVR